MQEQASVVPTRPLILVLAFATALIHLYLAFQFPEGPDPIFILNGLGYIGLTSLLYLPLPQLAERRGAIRWLLLSYTALTVMLWVLMGARTPLAFVDKAIELALIALLWRESQSP